MPGRLYSVPQYKGQPPVGVAITGLNPGDMLLAGADGGFTLYVAVATGQTNGSVILVDATLFQPASGNASALQSVAISTAAPTDGQALIFNDGQWAPGDSSGGGNATEIQSVPVNAEAPTNGQLLVFDSQSGEWEPADPLIQGQP